MPDTDHFKMLAQKLIAKDIVSAAGIVEGLDEETAAEVIEALPTDLAVRVIRNLQITFAATLLERADDAFLQAVLPKLEPQLLTALLMHLPEAQRERLKPYISSAIQAQIRELLEYPQGSVGRVVTTDYLSFDREVAAKDAIAKIRVLSRKRRPASYAYVVDSDKRLLGVLNMHDLMIAPPAEKLEAIMVRDVLSFHGFTDIQDAAAEFARRRFFAAPVVDSDNRMIGIIKAERLLKGVQDDTAQGIQKMVGVSGDEKPFSSILFSLKKRLLWLHINLVTAFMAAGVVAVFEDVIARITVLAVFLPVVAGQGGNAGAQSLAVVMRGIVMREIPPDRVPRLILKEGGLGAANGLIIGIVTAGVAWLWHGSPYLGLVIGLGMFFNLIFAGLAGASIPLAMKKIGIDPAQSSSIILTTVTDILGFFAFLGFAVLFQNHLV
jgi:magnesium transporter